MKGNNIICEAFCLSENISSYNLTESISRLPHPLCPCYVHGTIKKTV